MNNPFDPYPSVSPHVDLPVIARVESEIPSQILRPEWLSHEHLASYLTLCVDDEQTVLRAIAAGRLSKDRIDTLLVLLDMADTFSTKRMVNELSDLGLDESVYTPEMMVNDFVEMLNAPSRVWTVPEETIIAEPSLTEHHYRWYAMVGETAPSDDVPYEKLTDVWALQDCWHIDAVKDIGYMYCHDIISRDVFLTQVSTQMAIEGMKQYEAVDFGTEIR